MKLSNLLLFVLPVIISVIFTYFTYVNLLTVWIAFGVWLSMVVGFFIFINYYSVSKRSKKYYMPLAGKIQNYRIASFVTSFNEDPKIVESTLISVKNVTQKYGKVFLLDDSTNEEIRKELENFCKKNDIIYFHRENRKGFKAGAINEALKKIEDSFDLVAIFDADQRPLEGFFEQVIPYFSDPKVALVQIPQNYTETYTKIAQGAKYQQEPFLRIIMRGRSGYSAFSLGSGSVFRISALKDVGYFAEYSITEDAATSIKLNEKGYKTVYADVGLIWYGEPPEDLSAYLTQQSRWSFGYFQLLGEMLKSNLSFSQFFDYFSGFLYWVKEGPITILEFISPIIFLSLRIPIVKINPILYVLLYIPYLIITIVLFSFSVKEKGEYGLKGFYYHQVVEYLEFYAITLSFISWIFRRKIPFKVTPKGVVSRNFKLIIPHLIFIILLSLSDILGIIWYLTSTSIILKAAIIVNIFWSTYQIPFLLGGILASRTYNIEKPKYTEIVSK
ncbi:glycosyltransferase family 2 protein [Acidianus manzaensis]|nr:cellulose synthase catalytic subunit [Acidianus manzaensis]